MNTQVATSYKGTVPGTEVGHFFSLVFYLFYLDFFMQYITLSHGKRK